MPPLSHPASSHGTVFFVWVGAAVSPAVAEDTVVCRLHSVAEIVIRVKGRDVTIRLPSSDVNRELLMFGVFLNVGMT